MNHDSTSQGTRRIAKQVIWSLVALFVIFFIANANSGGSDERGAATDPVPTTRPVTTTATTTTVAGIGDPVRDGNFEFVVTRVYQPPTVDAFDDPLGVWVAVDLSVANVKNDPQNFSATAQALIVGGAEYESSWTMESDMFLNVNPGLSVDTTLFFDVPDTVLSARSVGIELHDSSFSGGVTVQAVTDWGN
ncbi:MAG: DUF4352 domain-containing protein [bacterium]|nr:DUF4352 domain-containing protein [bacterium]MDE0287234.1 DUF4352 domain-containing protein [bacterium]MDE0437412.1 DUF4352 domain-containing protein [bacterium]